MCMLTYEYFEELKKDKAGSDQAQLLSQNGQN
jgi:hypothetical protein